MALDATTARSWRHQSGRIAGTGWLLGAAGGAVSVLAVEIADWVGRSASVGVPDAWPVVWALLLAVGGGGPLGGVGGLWGAAIVLVWRGRRPPERRWSLVLRLAVAAALLVGGVGALALAFVDVLGSLYGRRDEGPIVALVTIALGSLATARIVALAADVRPAAAGPADGAPAPSPLVLGACLGPIAVSAAPLVASALGGEGLSLAPIFALLGIGIGPVVGLGLAVIATAPWQEPEEWPRPIAVRIALVVVLQVGVAALLTVAGVGLIAATAPVVPAVTGAAVLLAIQLSLLAAAARSHARHAQESRLAPPDGELDGPRGASRAERPVS